MADEQETDPGKHPSTPRPTPSAHARESGETHDANTDAADDGVSIVRVLRTTSLCAVFAGGGHAVLWVGYLVNQHAETTWFPWQPVVGIALATVATIAFGGFYAATRRARVAIAASFLLTFLVLLSYELTLTQLSVHYARVDDATALLADLRKEVGIIIGFYFGSEAAISVAKAIGVSRAPADRVHAIMTSDRDIAKVPAKEAVSVFKLTKP